MTPEPGRRERKKREAMRHIQRTALDLFDEHGFSHVTIERIAAVSEVSPSSVYRYFGTKEQLILYDEYDPQLMTSLERTLPDHDPVTALRMTLSTSFRQVLAADEEIIRRRMRYTMTEPSVRGEMLRESEALEAEVRAILTRHAGPDADDLAIGVVTAALMAAFMASITYWHESGYRQPLDTVIDRTLDVIEGGLHLR